MRVPVCPLPLVTDTAARLAAPPASGLRVTWLGHSTTLIEIDGARDPDRSDLERARVAVALGRAAPLPPAAAGARRPAAPRRGARSRTSTTITSTWGRCEALARARRAVPRPARHRRAPRGRGASRPRRSSSTTGGRRRRLPGGVRLVSTPARHFNGRGVPWRTGALWTSWSIVGPRHRVFFSGDTGPDGVAARDRARARGRSTSRCSRSASTTRAGATFTSARWARSRRFARLGAKTLLPIHWSTFVLAYHAWSEPAETLLDEAAEARASAC